MQRSLQSSFLGGAVVFPGGRVEPQDARALWPASLHTSSAEADGVWWDEDGFAARVAGCREALEEVGLLPLAGAPVSSDDLRALRAAASVGAPELRASLDRLGRALDLAALVPLARWVTPEAEQRRFDARFFLARAPAGQEPTVDRHEAIRAHWATPRQLLDDEAAGTIALFPPTHRTLEGLLAAPSVDAAIEQARRADLAPICPRFVLADGVPTLALPGDPLHAVRERRVAGPTRYVLRGERWVSEAPPG